MADRSNSPSGGSHPMVLRSCRINSDSGSNPNLAIVTVKVPHDQGLVPAEKQSNLSITFSGTNPNLGELTGFEGGSLVLTLESTNQPQTGTTDLCHQQGSDDLTNVGEVLHTGVIEKNVSVTKTKVPQALADETQQVPALAQFVKNNEDRNAQARRAVRVPINLDSSCGPSIASLSVATPQADLASVLNKSSSISSTSPEQTSTSLQHKLDVSSPKIITPTSATKKRAAKQNVNTRVATSSKRRMLSRPSDQPIELHSKAPKKVNHISPPSHRQPSNSTLNEDVNLSISVAASEADYQVYNHLNQSMKGIAVALEELNEAKRVVTKCTSVRRRRHVVQLFNTAWASADPLYKALHQECATILQELKRSN